MKYVKHIIILLTLCAFFTSASAVDGCLSSDGERFYYKLRSSPPNSTYEYYDGWYYTVLTPAQSGNCKVNGIEEYVLTTERSPRTARGRRCYIAGSNSITGTAYSYLRVYQCPIDDYIPLLVLSFGFFGFVFINRHRIA